MKEFKKVKPDNALAKGLLRASRERRDILARLPEETLYTTTMYFLMYDSIREMIDAILACDGYKSYSHVKSIQHLERYESITAAERNRLDVARQRRNNAQYYGRQVSIEDAKQFYLFMKKITAKLEKIFEEKL